MTRTASASRRRAAHRCLLEVRLALIAAAAAALTLPATVAQETEKGRPPLVVTAELDGIIHPVAVEYLSGTIDLADRETAEAVVIVLRTPGGLLDSTRTIVSRMLASRTPIVVFVGPSGSRAASAGFVLAMAADVTVMAPGTHIGAAHPVAGAGGQMDETMARKAASDTAAYVRSLAAARNRNTTLASEAVTESRSFTDAEALAAAPPLIDFVARDVADLLQKLDGRAVRRFDGRTITLRTADAVLSTVEMTRRQRFLSAIAHPQIAYLLLTLGIIGLTVELWNPGAIAPGVFGVLSLLLAFFAFQILSVDTSGLLLVIFGLALLVAELFVPSFGVLGVGGAIALLVGSVMLTDAVPGVRVGYGVIVPVVISISAIVLFLGRLALRAHRLPPAAGPDGMLGWEGRTRTAVSPDAPGYVDVHGELWRAVSGRPIAPHQAVRVTAIHGLTLHVDPVEPSSRTGGDAWKV